MPCTTHPSSCSPLWTVWHRSQSSQISGFSSRRFRREPSASSRTPARLQRSTRPQRFNQHFEESQERKILKKKKEERVESEVSRHPKTNLCRCRCFLYSPWSAADGRTSWELFSAFADQRTCPLGLLRCCMPHLRVQNKPSANFSPAHKKRLEAQTTKTYSFSREQIFLDVSSIDPSTLRLITKYRYEDNKKVELICDIGAIWRVLIPSFRKPQSSPPENEPFSQEMHLKIPLLSRGFKLSNSKPRCRVSALHLFVK